MVEFSGEGIEQFLSSRPKNACYVFDEPIRELLDAVKESCRSRVITLPRTTTLWRAQLGHDWKVEILEICEHKARRPYRAPYQKKRMKPLQGRGEGRLNPKGTACLYLAQSEHTAMSEVRPWRGEYISLGRFRATKPLRLVDCTSEEEGCLDAPTIENAAWGDINAAFAKPVVPSDPASDYVPTQILAELFRREGYDGIQYRSSIDATGKTVALFNPRHATCEQVCLRITTSVTYNFDIANDLNMKLPRSNSLEGGYS
ncbi:MAG: RES family NAD+ phosphorylase [Candidatus Solibacter sp.]|nr:RES family NAD+ phosphorylase [Candidatus Solibacter sp.]